MRMGDKKRRRERMKEWNEIKHTLQCEMVPNVQSLHKNDQNGLVHFLSMYSQKYLRGSLSNLVKPMASIASALSSASIVMPNKYPLYGTRMFPKASWCLQQNPGPIQAQRGMRDHQPRTQTTSTSDFWPRPFQPPPENTAKTWKVKVTTIFCFCSPSCKSTFPLETLSLLRLFSPLTMHLRPSVSLVSHHHFGPTWSTSSAKLGGWWSISCQCHLPFAFLETRW